MVFQRPTPFAGTVRENLQVAEPALGDGAAAQALERVGLSGGFVDRDARELSGGEAQRVCLARTLVTNPEVVLMDEVTSSVDPSATRALEELGAGLAAAGVPVLWVTHDLQQMLRLADHVLVVIDGKIVHAGGAAALETDAPGVVRRFLAGEEAT
jgi:putative ABC transport system ATP-binding protein